MGCRRICVFSLLAVWLVPSVQAAEGTKSDLPSCAARLGRQMVEHWLVVDLSRQIERGLFYQGKDGRDPHYDRLKESITRTQQDLERAYGQFKVLHESKSPETGELVAELDRIEARNARESNEAEQVLGEVGRAVDPAGFRAVVVPEEVIEPAWEPGLVDKDYRPKRVLFGTSGRTADDRLLTLKFDFGNGLGPLGAVAPMATPDKLDLPENVLNRTSPDHVWMTQHKVGYHYWAGVYNNQNTYAAPWFRQQFPNDDDVWMKLADGKVLKSNGDWEQFNIWNPHMRDYIQRYAAVQARTLKDDPALVCYDYAGEPHPFGAQPPGKPQYAGYNDSAVSAFRDYLRKKFPTIEALNRSWKTSYSGFDAIRPPPDPYVTPRVKATPLSYEFERFRWDSETAYFKLVYDAYRANDPAKPIEAHVSQYMSSWPVEALDAYGLQKAGAVDWADMHMNNFWPNLPEQIYLYSLCRLTRKVPVQFEYVWTFPRTGPVDDNNESDFRATCEASVWRNLTWGRKVLVFFDLGYDWPAYHNAFLDSKVGYSILRPSACVIPTVKRKALRFNDLLMNTEVADPPIVVMQPKASVLNSPPVHPNEAFSFHTAVAGHGVHDLLFPRNYPFLYVPEEAVLDDGYPLNKHKVIILPQAPYLPEAMTDLLLDWVRQGGTLVSIGVPGIWNPYGQDDLRLVTRVFGPSRVTDAQPGKWEWVWEPTDVNPATEMIRDKGTGKVVTARTRYGKGTVLMVPRDFDAPPARDLFYRAIDAAIVHRPARCTKDSFELVLRQDAQGRRYLFVLNPHTRQTREDEVILAGPYARCIDLGVGSGVPIPAAVRPDATTMKLRLEPGEGTVIALTSR